MLDPLPEEVRALMNAGRKMDAVALLRSRTNLGLAEAKNAVEAGGMVTALATGLDGDELPDMVRAALAAGNKLEAIRLLCESRGVGLREAKTLVDASLGNAQMETPQHSSGLAPGEVPQPKFRVGYVGFLVALALLAWLAWLVMAAS